MCHHFFSVHAFTPTSYHAAIQANNAAMMEEEGSGQDGKAGEDTDMEEGRDDGATSGGEGSEASVAPATKVKGKGKQQSTSYVV